MTTKNTTTGDRAEEEKARDLLYGIWDKIDDRLGDVLTSIAIKGLELDMTDTREEYERWFGEDHLTKAYDKAYKAREVAAGRASLLRDQG